MIIIIIIIITITRPPLRPLHSRFAIMLFYRGWARAAGGLCHYGITPAL